MDELKGIKVVELATMVAVPTCGKFFADQGAEVIKIESLGGDPYRFLGASEWRSTSQYENTSFDVDNGGKKSIAVDLKNPKGKEILFKLLKGADIFITNWRKKALERQDLSYEQLHRKFPNLVYADFSGYGDDGPDKDLPGYDFTAFWARSGALECFRDKDSRPMNPMPGFGDRMSGFVLASSVLAAYIKAKNTGKGERVTTNLLHIAIFAQATLMMSEQYPQYGKSFPISYKTLYCPFNGTFETADGRYFQTCAPAFNQLFARYMTALGREDLIGNPRYTIENISENDLYVEFTDILIDEFKKRNVSEWIDRFTEQDIPFSICQTYKEVLNDAHANAMGAFYEMHYPTGNTVKIVRQPVHIGSPQELKRAPYLGEQSEEILRYIGYNEEEISAMKSNRVITEWKDIKSQNDG